MTKPFLTIFTPTYNRAYKLPFLYESLTRQTNKEFEWLIVDDGSNDDTRDIVNDWIEEGKVNIRYFYQENAGKMNAHNRGVQECNTPLFLCVDSDDYLVDEAVSIFFETWRKLDNTQGLAGIVTPKGKKNGDLLGTGTFPNNIRMKFENISSYYKGDSALCLITDVIKKYPFPYIEGEKFITEDFVYIQINEEYEFLMIPNITIICEYLPDGYTNHVSEITYRNPVGCMYYQSQHIKFHKNHKELLRAYITYNMYRIIAGKGMVNKTDLTSRDRFFLNLLYPVGYAAYLARKRKVEL